MNADYFQERTTDASNASHPKYFLSATLLALGVGLDLRHRNSMAGMMVDGLNETL